MSPDRVPVAVRVIVTLILFSAFLTAIHRFLSPGETLTEPGQQVMRTTEKAFVFVVDGMRPEDAADSRVTFLAPFREHGFVATIQPCLEALTVPCVSEAFTGTATAGLLGAYNNLVATSEINTPSLFSDMIAAGRTTGVVHLGQYKGFSKALTRQYSGKDPWPQVERYIDAGIDLIVWHYPKLDEAAHHHKPDSKEYAAALRQLDADGKRLVARLPESYRLSVMGDHGHTKEGRHIFGLDIPTSFLTDGEWFGTAPVEGRLPLPTYRYLIGAPLGFLPPSRYDGANLADRLPEGSEMRAAALTRTFVGPREDVSPAEVIVTALALSAFALWNLGAVRGLAAAGIGLAGVAGYAYLTVLPLIHYTPFFPYVRQRLALTAIGIGVLGWLFRRNANAVFITLMLAALALPATIYNYGLFQNLIWGLALLAGATSLELVRARPWRELLPWAALLLACWIPITDPFVGTFRLHYFTVIHKVHTAVCVVAWALMAAAFVDGRWKRVVAGAAAALGASGVVLAGGYPLAVVTVAIVVVGWRWPRWLPVAASFAALPWYRAEFATGVALCVGFAVAFARIVHNTARAEWLVPIGTVAFAWLALAMSARLRISGLDFDFAIKWFADDAHLTWWPVIALALLVKVMVPPALVVYGVRRAVGPIDLTWASRGVLLRWGATAMGISGLLASNSNPPRYRLLEQIEETLAWGFALTALLVFGKIRHGFPDGATPTTPARTAPRSSALESPPPGGGPG